MSFTSIPVIANDKTKPEYIFSSIEMFLFFMSKLLPKENKTILSSNHTILSKCMLVTYTTDRNG